MKLKKMMSVILVGAMAASMLIGCGGAPAGEETPAEEPKVAEETGSNEEISATEETASFEGFDELQEIQMYGLSFFGENGLPEVLDAINAIAEEKINVHVTFNPMDVATYMEQMGLMLSSGEKMDLILGTPIASASFSTMAAQNELMDIAPYLDEYAPELKALMGDYLSATTVGDEILGVPCYRIYNSNDYIVMRKDILDELGLTEQAQNVSSWTELEEIMYAVRDAQDTLPEEMKTNAIICNADAVGNIITPSYCFTGADAFAEHVGFDNLGDATKLVYVDENGKVNNYFASDSYRQAVERVGKWYQEGLIYKDAATSQETGDTLMRNGVTFAFAVQSEIGVEVAKATATGYDVVCVEFAQIPIQTSNGNTWEWSVPVTSENPEAAVAFLNLMYTVPEIENLLVYGIEGRDYTLNEAGEACLTPDHVYQSSDFFFGNQFNAYPAEGTGGDFRQVALENMKSAAISPYYGLVVDTDPIANEITSVTAALKKYESGLESGTTDISNLDKMLAELDQAGALAMIEYYQSQLDEWLAK